VAKVSHEYCEDYCFLVELYIWFGGTYKIHFLKPEAVYSSARLHVRPHILEDNKLHIHHVGFEVSTAVVMDVAISLGYTTM
jgi:hypothetical protein